MTTLSLPTDSTILPNFPIPHRLPPFSLELHTSTAVLFLVSFRDVLCLSISILLFLAKFFHSFPFCYAKLLNCVSIFDFNSSSFSPIFVDKIYWHAQAICFFLFMFFLTNMNFFHTYFASNLNVKVYLLN